MAGTAEDFAAASAKDAVEETVLNDNEVDFEWVIRGFLSYYFPINYGWKNDTDIIVAVPLNPLFFLAIVDIVRSIDEFLKLY